MLPGQSMAMHAARLLLLPVSESQRAVGCRNAWQHCSSAVWVCLQPLSYGGELGVDADCWLLLSVQSAAVPVSQARPAI
jgi:hypothetical protein